MKTYTYIKSYHIKSTGKLTTSLRITQQKKKLEEYVNLLLIEGEHDHEPHLSSVRKFIKFMETDTSDKKYWKLDYIIKNN